MVVLHQIDQHHQPQHPRNRPTDDDHGHRAQRREAEDQQRQTEEHRQEVENAEPAVAGGDVAEEAGQWNGPAHCRHRVEEEDAADVEEQVTEGQLKGVLNATRVGGQRREDT